MDRWNLSQPHLILTISPCPFLRDPERQFLWSIKIAFKLSPSLHGEPTVGKENECAALVFLHYLRNMKSSLFMYSFRLHREACEA